MNNTPINDRIREIAVQAAEANGVEFVQSEIAGSKKNLTVRVYIDKTAGVTVDDCSEVSRAMEAVLDADDLIPQAYTLEVSSPGLERGLFSLHDFEKFAGYKAKVKTKSEVDGQKSFTGRIVGVEGSEIVFDDRLRGQVRFPFETVAKANLRVDLQEEFKRH